MIDTPHILNLGTFTMNSFSETQGAKFLGFIQDRTERYTLILRFVNEVTKSSI